MKCPHCRVEFHDESSRLGIGEDVDGRWSLLIRACPACDRLIMELLQSPRGGGELRELADLVPITTRLVWPRASARPPCPTEVPPAIREDYNEACLVLPDSPKASAALGRRCLQSLLRDAAKVKPADLYNEIQEVLDSKALPTHISNALDAVRVIGNFAAHPIKSKHTGEVVSVEAGEAEWNLEVLESLFDFYYVQPAVLKARKDALNAKLTAAGKATIP